MTDFFQTWHRNSWREQRKKTGQTVIENCPWAANMKRFAAIEFKRKQILLFCSPTHLVSDWYWTLIAQINLWLSNRLVNINHLYLPRHNFSSIFRSRQEFLCQVWKKSVLCTHRTQNFHFYMVHIDTKRIDVCQNCIRGMSLTPSPPLTLQFFDFNTLLLRLFLS